MSKAAPRSQKGAEFDMREAAQEAARREGLSLGEWMAQAISERLGDRGADEGGDDAEVRLEAVAAELARLSSEAPITPSRRSAAAREKSEPEVAAPPPESAVPFGEPGVARAAFFESRVASVLAQIDIRLGDIERRLRRGERAALGALRDAVGALHDRLAEIETALAEKNLTGEDRPLRAMLVRLENRVEALSRQGRDEQGALSQLESRLQNLLDSLAVARPTALRGGVGEAIDAIAERQRSLDASARHNMRRHDAQRQDAQRQDSRHQDARHQDARHNEPEEAPGSARPRLDALSAKVAQMVGRLAERAPRAEVAALEQALGALSARIDASIASGAEPAPAALERLEGQIGALSERLDQMVAALQTRDATPWQDISSRLDRLATRIDQPRSTDTAAVDGLSRRLDDLQAAVVARPTVDVAPALAGLDRKIDALTQRLDRDGGRAEEARNAQDISDLRARAAASERMTQQSLSAVQETLEKVVDRLAMIEEDVVGARPASTRVAMHEIADHFLVEPGAGRPVPAAQAHGSVHASAAAHAPVANHAPAAAHAPAQKVAQPASSRSAPDAALRLDAVDQPVGGRTTPAKTSGAPEVTPPSKKDSEIFSPVNYIEIARRALAARAAADGAATAASKTIEPGAELAGREKVASAGSSRGSSWRGPAAMCAALMLTSFAGWQAFYPTPAPTVEQGAEAFARATATAAVPAITLPPKADAAPPAPTAPDMSPTGSIANQTTVAARQSGYAPVPSPTGVAATPAARAVNSDAQAQYDLGVRLAEGRDQPQNLTAARAAFEKAADAGYAPAQYRLGALYEKGVLGAGDPQIAVDFYRKAAMQGHVRAMHNLAVALSEGVGGKPDYAGAAQWFRRAAEYGLRDSEYNIAVLYGRGLGAPQDYIQSYVWFALAAAQGDTEAGRKRDELLPRLSPGELVQARKAVADFRAKTPDPVVNGQSTTSAAARSISRS